MKSRAIDGTLIGMAYRAGMEARMANRQRVLPREYYGKYEQHWLDGYDTKDEKNA